MTIKERAIQMADTMPSRLIQIREGVGLNQAQFALSFEGQPTGYGRAEKGRTTLSVESILQIYLKYDIDVHWLITGNRLLSDDNPHHGQLSQKIAGADDHDSLRAALFDCREREMGQMKRVLELERDNHRLQTELHTLRTANK